jgi:hypothetical protein
MRTKSKRFSVSVSEEDYLKLQKIAKKHKPALTLQYLVDWSIQRLLEDAENPQLSLNLGSPLGKERL